MEEVSDRRKNVDEKLRVSCVFGPMLGCKGAYKRAHDDEDRRYLELEGGQRHVETNDRHRDAHEQSHREPRCNHAMVRYQHVAEHVVGEGG